MQNANAHHSGIGPQWKDTIAFWQAPNAENAAAATAHLSLQETLSWMEDLPRMEAHVLDGGHFLLETHAAQAGRLMRDFVAHTLSAHCK